MSNFLDKLLIRVMEKHDLDFIVNIDTKVLGETRRDYWVTKIVKQAETRPHDASLVAEIDGKVIGFILGESKWLGIQGPKQYRLDRYDRYRPRLSEQGDCKRTRGHVRAELKKIRRRHHLHACQLERLGSPAILSCHGIFAGGYDQPRFEGLAFALDAVSLAPADALRFPACFITLKVRSSRLCLPATDAVPRLFSTW